jgi:Flp pilus assembly protein TadD
MEFGPLSTFPLEDRMAIQSIQGSFLQDPAMPGMAADLSRYYCRVKDYRNAINILRQVLAAMPDDIPTQCLLAETLFERGDAIASTVLLEALLERYPDHAAIHITYGEILYQWGRYEAAKASLFKAIDLDPTSAQAYSDLAVIFVREGKLEQAVASIHRAHQADPNHPDVIVNYERIISLAPRQTKREDRHFMSGTPATGSGEG